MEKLHTPRSGSVLSHTNLTHPPNKLGYFPLQKGRALAFTQMRFSNCPLEIKGTSVAEGFELFLLFRNDGLL